MKKFSQIAGLAGVVLLILGGVVALVQQRVSALVMGHLALGAALLALGALSNLPEIKEALMKRSARMGPQVFIQTLLILVILVFVNWIALRHDVTRDMTRAGLFTFGPVTEDVVSHLPGDVEVLAFFPGGGPGEARQRLLLYASSFPRVKLRFIDPDKHEEIARAEAVPPEVGALLKYGPNRVWINKFEEEDITNGFIKVIRETKPKVWFTTGHMEPGLDSTDINGLSYLDQMLKQQGYEPRQVDLQTVDNIPADVSMVAIIGPVTAFNDDEIKKLDYYMAQGGNAIILLDPVLEEATMTGIEKFIEPYGIHADYDVVFDPKNHLSRDQLGLYIVVSQFPSHPISEGLSEPRAVFYLARPLGPNNFVAPNLQLNQLARTSSDSYAKPISPSMLGNAPTKEEGQRRLREFMESPPGPDSVKGGFALAYAITKEYQAERWKEKAGADRSRQMRLVVMGASSVCRNLYISMPYNYELCMNAFNWLAGESDLKYIRSPRRGGSRIFLEQSQKDKILYATVMILPEAFMIIGLAVWWRRR
ncbi:MAG TPA: GldG family protein [bacterium]|nr:GldG family protein [bacterium]